MGVDPVGRVAERDAAERLLDRVGEGPAALVFVGEAGIGKTTLWAATLERARVRGHRVLRARAAPAESGLSYAALADLLADVPPTASASLPTVQRDALDAVLLRAPVATGSDHRVVGAAFLATLDSLAASGPVLVAVDDLPWIDPSSRQALRFALRRVEGRVGLLATGRADAASELDPDLVPGAPVEGIRLGPLDDAALAEIVVHRTRATPRPIMARIAEISGGNPFYALELARAATDGIRIDRDLPAGLAALVARRIAGLTPTVREALLTVAAAGAGSTPPGISLAEAERAGIITIDPTGPRFTHPLLASGVLAIADPAARRAVHRRLADRTDDPEQRARHLALAADGHDPDTVAALADAARRARGRGATATAAELMASAVEMGDDAEHRLLWGQYLFDAGEPARARAVLEDLVAGAVADRAEALRVLAVVRLHDDSYHEAHALLEEALAVADDVPTRTRIGVDLSYVRVNLGRIPEADAFIDGVVADAERAGDPSLLAVASATAAIVHFLAGHGLDAASLERALALEDPSYPVPAMLRPTLIRGLILSWSGELDAARRVLHGLWSRCLERGEESDLMFVAFHLVLLECWRGDPDAADEIATDTERRARGLGTDLPRAIALSTRAVVAAHRGDIDEARRSAQGALSLLAGGSAVAATVWPLVTLGVVAVSVEDHEGAVAVLEPMIVGVATMGYGEPTAAPFAADAAEALIAVGRLDEARAVVDALERDGRRLDRAWALALGARCRGLLLAADGDLDGAAAALSTALDEHDRLPIPLERARTLLVLGRLERRRRRKRTARELLSSAEEVFVRIGATAWAERARRELARVASVAAAGELSPSERRVAELTAAGRTNREVAAALSISPKTVEANLARVYRKLGIRTRAELGRRMERETPDSPEDHRP